MAKDKKKTKVEEPVVETKKKKGKDAPAPEPEKKAKKKGKSTAGPTEGGFADPSSGDQFVSSEHLGQLCLFSIYEFESGFKTSAGESDIVRGDVVVLTSKKGKALDEPELYENTIVFGKVLVSTLKAQVGKMAVLGVLSLGAKQEGKNQAYILKPADDDGRKIAIAYQKANNPLA
jgi:hypothetical protein